MVWPMTDVLMKNMESAKLATARLRPLTGCADLEILMLASRPKITGAIATTARPGL